MLHWTMTLVAAALVTGILGWSTLAGPATGLARGSAMILLALALGSLRTGVPRN